MVTAMTEAFGRFAHPAGPRKAVHSAATESHDHSNICVVYLSRYLSYAFIGKDVPER
jgi:hypothetical protein